jgi:hypothetical protein
MAVTDLTDSLPYWARQGVGYGGGPGPTGGPGSAPMGAGNSASWLQYLQQMFGPQAAQAAENDPIAALNSKLQTNPPGPPPPDNTITPPVGPPPASALRPPGISQPAGVSASGLPLQPGSLAPGALSQFASAADGPIGSGGNVPWPSGGGSMNQTAPPPVGQTAPGSVPGPLTTGGAAGVGATSNPRFVSVDRPNASAAGGIGRGGPPQMTALNLAGLFNGGGPSSRVMSPANVAAPAPQQRVSGPLAQGGIANAPLPPTMPDDLRRQRAIQLAAARSGFA